jgi:acetylornithine deacetylase
MYSISELYNTALQLLKSLIETPSFSKEEDATATIIENFFKAYNIPTQRIGNNVYAQNLNFDHQKKTILLNSHHDTVKPNNAYTLNPFTAIEKEGKLYGLGSNDAGGCLVALAACFLYFYHSENLNYNIIFAASAEEEISGANGIELLLPHLKNKNIDCGIVGEPTKLEMAIAERGLMVVDGVALGKPGHAARKEGENALYKAIEDIKWIQNYSFAKASPLLGECMMTVTVIDTPNKQHNVVPSVCNFTIDIRVNELYTFEEIINILQQNLSSTITPRSTRLKSSYIAVTHPLVQAGLALGKTYYGSPTTSDKALMHFPTLKIGPGDSARSHSANEFIYLEEIKEGIETYIQLLNKIL